MKTCGRCDETKPLSEFHTCSNQRDKKHTICKHCRILYNTPKAFEWNQKNKERWKANLKRYDLSNKDAENEKQRATYRIVRALGATHKEADAARKWSVVRIAETFLIRQSTPDKEGGE